METKEEKTNYRNRRKTFHFSQKNDDLLQYLNSKDTKEQSTFIMRLIREEMEREKNGDPLAILQVQLNQALEELNRLKEKLANPTPVEVTATAVEGGGIDEDIRHSNEQNFNDMKNLLKGVNIDVVATEEVSEDSEDLSDEEFDELFDDDLDF